MSCGVQAHWCNLPSIDHPWPLHEKRKHFPPYKPRGPKSVCWMETQDWNPCWMETWLLLLNLQTRSPLTSPFFLQIVMCVRGYPSLFTLIFVVKSDSGSLDALELSCSRCPSDTVRVHPVCQHRPLLQCCCTLLHPCDAHYLNFSTLAGGVLKARMSAAANCCFSKIRTRSSQKRRLVNLAVALCNYLAVCVWGFV